MTTAHLHGGNAGSVDSEMAGRLAGKVCIITGTGGSMGRAAALTFAREGAWVVGCDVTVEPAKSKVKHRRPGTK